MNIVIFIVVVAVILLATKNRKQVLIAFDQMINARLNGWADESFSARCWRCRNDRKYARLVKVIDLAFFWDKNHCEKSWLSEVNRRHLPPEYRGDLK